MRKSIVVRYLLATSFFLALMTFAFSWSYSNKSQPPAARTNAPGENSCNAAGCHFGTLNSGPGSVSLVVGSGLTSYQPLKTYTITVGVTDANKSRFGFELTALDDNNTVSVGTFVLTNTTNTTTLSASPGGNSRQYVGHKNATANQSWTFDWTAPTFGTDTVTFYLAGNATNANNSSSGDAVYAATFKLAEAPAPPVTSFTSSKSFACVGDSVFFTDQTAGNPTTWAWSFPGGTPNSSSVQNPVIQYFSIGPHNVQLITTNANGSDTLLMTSMVSVSANPNIMLTSLANETCFGDSTGAIDIFIQGGTPNYSYNWSNGATTQDITNLPVGGYTLTVTDVNGCDDTDSFTVAASTPIVLTDTFTFATCGLNDGSATVNASGGNGNYTYAWSNGGTTPTISNLAAGSYSVVVTDFTGCADSTIINVSNPGAPTVSGNSTDVSCNGSADGSVTIQVSGGNGALQYSWSNGDSTQNLSALSGGTYSVTITDTAGCTAVESFVVNEPSALSLTMSATAATSGNADGTSSATVAGGKSPYTYSWNSFPVQTTMTASNLPGGWYTVTVTDSAGCSISDSVEVQVVVGLKTIISKQLFSIYPVPAKDKIYVDYPLSRIPTLQLYSIDGSKRSDYLADFTHAGEVEIDIANLPVGLYFMEFRWAEFSWTGKFLKVE